MSLELKRDPKSGIYQIHGTVTVWKGGEPHSIQIRRSAKTRDKGQADAIKRQIEGEVAERNYTGREPAITFAEAAARYERNGGERRYLTKVVAQLGKLRIDAIGQVEIEDAAFRAYPDPALSSATIRRQFYAPALAILRANGHHPIVKRPSDGQQRTYFFTPKRANDLLEAIVASRYPNPWTPAFATFLFGQGVRVSEAIGIDGRDDIDLDNGYAILRDTKNGDQRSVALIPKVKAALSAIPNLGDKGPLFLRYDGTPYEDLSHGRRLRFWIRACETIGVDPAIYTPHTARHSWATWFYAQTLDIVRLRQQGGWKSDAWERYVKMPYPGLGQEAKRLGWDFRQRNGSGSNSARSLQASR
ncbi:tyrosine-type recombinase/integrase [Aureimonas psammosilenae]|uniref:tyrosine-type recombinase/integrase n=1 Tax=Aureimonas psammosilenae TaxID=2495496 RepID=UPI001260EF82|nr:tyrosine-type recombinase/integrase [Aureimonas psammosilenae]